MAEEFSKAVDDGLRLSKRLYLGKDTRAVSSAPPKPPPPMEYSSSSASGGLPYLPTSPMVYAVISDPTIVDNPDIPSYQPHVHGRCDPPALIPLPMNKIELEIECHVDTAVIKVTGSWRVHCVKSSRSCGCRVAIPMGEKGSILGVEVEIPRKTFYTSVIKAKAGEADTSKAPNGHGGFLNVKPHIFTLTTPPVDGGVNLTVRMSWSQKLVYRNGEFHLDVPFTFPEFVVPPGKKYLKKEKIQLSVSSAGLGSEILFKGASHPLKEVKSQDGKLGFKYEGDVVDWSGNDFHFSYAVSSSQIHGAVISQAPSMDDVDQREILHVSLLPGNQQSGKGFRRNIVFVVDISGSMQGKPLEDTKTALLESLLKLDPQDSFCIIAFNGQTYTSSTSLKSATKETIDSAIEWISINCVAGGDTNISRPLNMAIDMLSNSSGALPIVLLITDGAVEDERQICDAIKKRLASDNMLSPRIYTFGLGSFCNHYFLRMLAMIGRGQHDAAYDIDLVQPRIQKLFGRASSVILTNITMETLDDLDDVEVFPCQIPDLSFESPLSVSGRFRGKLPESFKVKGLSADMSSIVIDLKLQDAKDIPLHRVCAKEEIELLTAQAWLLEDKQLEDKVAKLSKRVGVFSEYTRMGIFQKEEVYQKGSKKGQSEKKEIETLKMILPDSLCVGFGDLAATSDYLFPGTEPPKLPEAAEIFLQATSNCCGSMCNNCCCLSFIKCCSHINPQCANGLMQLFTGLACAGCLACCSEVCCGGGDGGS